MPTAHQDMCRQLLNDNHTNHTGLITRLGNSHLQSARQGQEPCADGME